MKKAIGLTFFIIVFALSLTAAIMIGEQSVKVERNDKKEYSFGIVSGEGFSVTDENPKTVRSGRDVSFDVSLEEGYYFADLSGGILEDGAVRYENVSSGRSVVIKARRIDDLPTVVCESVGEGRAFVSADFQKERYLPGEKVEIVFSCDENHILSSLEINGKRSPLPSLDRMELIVNDDLTIKAHFDGKETFLSAMSSGAGGEIENKGAKTQYRYGDKIDLLAKYDSATTDFVGWSLSDSAASGAQIISTEDEYEATMTGDLIIFANFRLIDSFVLSFDSNGADSSSLPSPRTYGAGEIVSIPIDDGSLVRDGYKLIGYSTSPDIDRESGGTFVSCGAMFVMPSSATTLYAVWYEYTPASYFRYKVIGKYGMSLCGFSEEGLANRPERIVIPEKLGAQNVTNIDSASFYKCDFIKEVYLPDSAKTMGPLAFASCPNLELVSFGENYTAMGENAFDDCPNFTKMRVHATLSTVFDIDYDSTLVDKYMRLITTKGKKRIILAGGSNLSMGIDSEAIMEAYPGYEVVNFSTSAHYGLMPLLQLLRANITENDVIVFALEYTETMYARKETTTYTNWQYIESNYDILRDIDIHTLPGLLCEYVDYLNSKRNFIASGKKKYNSVIYSRASFNIYGDNISKRESADSISAILPDTSIITKEGIGRINDFCSYAAALGAKCYFSYPTLCRSEHSEEMINKYCASFEEKLKLYLDETLCPIITDQTSIMYDTVYYYDTQYHLTNEGAEMRTSVLIDDLSKVLK